MVNSLVRPYKSASAPGGESEPAAPLTRVMVIADTLPQVQQLTDVFAHSMRFVITTLCTAQFSDWRPFDSTNINVLVIRTKLPIPSFILGDAPILWLGRAVTDRQASKRTHAVLAEDAIPGQIRAAALALSAGLHFADAVPPQPVPNQKDEFAFAEPLTERELEVLNLVAEGLSNPQIAKRLRVSRNTVKFHVGSVMGKLAARSRTEAVTLGLRRGLIII